MKPEKFHATDYTPSEVEAAKRVMIEVAQNLGEYADACVVVGGWVPELLLPEAEPKHTGSIDVDLALNPERLSGERYASLLDTLKRKGYQPGEKPFQLFKEVKVGQEAVRVDVEFLAPKGAKMKKNRPKRVPGFRVLEAEGCALAFDDPAIVILEGMMPDERPNRVSIRVASVADFLVMKAFVRSGSPNQLAFREYINAVWQQAQRVVASASEIWFIGYSFAMMDCSAVIDLLTHAKQCRRLVVQNRRGHAEQICQMLSVEYPNLGFPLEPYGCEF